MTAVLYYFKLPNEHQMCIIFIVLTFNCLVICFQDLAFVQIILIMSAASFLHRSELYCTQNGQNSIECNRVKELSWKNMSAQFRG